MMPAERDRHFFDSGPKRILSLDGGGTLGVIEIAFLERIEKLLRDARGGDPNFRLCHWFDLIGGTSTGAIIATCLATGMTANEVKELYFDLAPRIFRRSPWRLTGMVSRFNSAPLEHQLQATFGDETLDSPRILTGLAIMARRFDTGSPWLFSNNPRAPYWNDGPDRAFVGNLNFKLTNVIRASTAAPGYFRPEMIQVVPVQPPVRFVDGGLSPYNNPALYLLLLSQAKAFRLEWKTGADNLSLLSLGAGQFRRAPSARSRWESVSGYFAARALLSSLSDGQHLTLTLLQWLGDSPSPWQINSEIGDLSTEFLGDRAFLRFQRYDLPIDASWLNENLNAKFSPKQICSMQRFDNPGEMHRIYDLAADAALRQVQLAHL